MRLSMISRIILKYGLILRLELFRQRSMLSAEAKLRKLRRITLTEV
jgi:hypothetical protein